MNNLEYQDEAKLFKFVDLKEDTKNESIHKSYSYFNSVFKTFIKKPSAIIAISLLILLIFGIIIIPIFTPDGWLDISKTTDSKNIAPNFLHWWGTDAVGRDLFFMCFKGAGKSLFLALISSGIVLVFGTVIGLIWGYFKKIDFVFVEIYNLISNIPSLLIYMLLSTIFTSAFPLIPAEIRLIISLTITGWIGLSRLIRNQILIIDNREYNLASKNLGSSAFKIMSRNYLPYLLAIIITEFSLIIPSMISSEVSMSYFGVGLPSNEISIGAILNLGRQYFNERPWQLLAPAFLLALIILIFFLLGLALSDAMDPKKHR